jgi:hypothetical protein
MNHSRRRMPSPALAIACLALFVALGGTVLAATKINGHTIRVKSLPGNRLAVRSLPGNRLKPGTIPGNRIAPHSLKGDRIDIGTLGKVPEAAHADSADTARRAATATAADHATDATTVNGHSVGCPAGKRQFAGACWDYEPRPGALDAVGAARACAVDSGELPGALELIAFQGLTGVRAAATSEWTNQIGVVTETVFSAVTFTAPETLRERQPGELHEYRCVTPLID